MIDSRVWSRERNFALGVGVCLIAIAWAYKAYTNVYVEDALIIFRYAENIAAGNGFVYNPGEKVLGSTTALYTLLLAFFGFFFGAQNIWVISDVITSLAFAGTGICIYLSFRELKFEPWVGLVGAGIFAIDSRTLNYAMGGMETGFVTFFMMLSFFLLLRKMYPLLGMVLGLLQLTRPDAVFWQILVFGFLFFHDRKAIPKVALCLVAVNLPWWIFAYSYFGNIVPHSVLAKRQEEIASLGTVLQNLWASRRHYYLPTYPEKVSIVFVLLGVWRLFKDLSWKSPLTLFLLYPPLFFFGLVLGKAPYFPWYYVPSSMAAQLLGTLGVGFLLREAMNWIKQTSMRKYALSFALVATSLLFLTMTYMLSREAEKHRIVSLNEMGFRRVVGEWIATNAAPDAVVAMEAIGYQGYFAKRRVFDLAGLITPKTLEYKECSGRGFKRFISEVKPDYIIFREFELQENSNFAWCSAPFFHSEPDRRDFERQYRIEREFHVPIDDGSWGIHGHLVVLKRN